jgi:hypothetical protein
VKHSLICALLVASSAIAEPLCLPLEAGGTGTKSTSAMVHGGGKATWWWCPGVDFAGTRTWTLEWYGWEADMDQFFGMQGFRPDDAETVRQAWRATRQADFSRTYFPTNVLEAAQATRPKPEIKR